MAYEKDMVHESLPAIARATREGRRENPTVICQAKALAAMLQGHAGPMTPYMGRAYVCTRTRLPIAYTIMPASVHCPKAPCYSMPSGAKNQEIRSDSQAIGPSRMKTVSNSGEKSCLVGFVLYCQVVWARALIGWPVSLQASHHQLIGRQVFQNETDTVSSSPLAGDKAFNHRNSLVPHV
jgi:hypothetical protein